MPGTARRGYGVLPYLHLQAELGEQAALIRPRDAGVMVRAVLFADRAAQSLTSKDWNQQQPEFPILGSFEPISAQFMSQRSRGR